MSFQHPPGRSCDVGADSVECVTLTAQGVRPARDVSRRPLQQMVHWNGYQPTKFRPDAMVAHYIADVRPFAMYRGVEDADTWDDADKRLGVWRDAFTAETPNPSGKMP